MAKQTVNLGTSPSGAGGDTFRSSASKFQANDNELYAALGGSSGTLPSALPIANGGTGGTTASTARDALGLTLTSAVNDKTVGRVMKVGDFGLGGNSVDLGSIATISSSGFGYSSILFGISAHSYISARGTRSFILGAYTNRLAFATRDVSGDYTSPYEVKTSANTTVDANGFIKAASPIVQLYADKIELNDEAQQQEITFEKLDVGQYLIKGSTGFALEGWYVETPKDANGNVLFSVIYDTLENGDISVKTYKKKFDLEIASIVADLSQPVDITPGRWIDLRLQEISVEELELAESSTPPDFQPTNLSQAVAEAMVTYDDTEQ